MKPRVSKCGNHWTCEYWSGRPWELPEWYCRRTWGEAMVKALEIVAKQQSVIHAV